MNKETLSTDPNVKRRLYEIWLALGHVSHVLGNECDPEKGEELLEPIMEELRGMWDE